MKTVTLLEFRNRAAQILDAVERGTDVILTRRGKPSVKLTRALPRVDQPLPPDDPVFHLERFVIPGRRDKRPLDPRDIDRLVTDI